MEYPKKTTDFPQVTEKLYHIIYWVYLAWPGFDLTTLVVIDRLMSNSLLGVVVGGFLHGKMFQPYPLYLILLVAIKT